MSGYERILARVSGADLRDYCSSAIEDELRHVKHVMESLLADMKRAREVSAAVAKLRVPLDASAAAFEAVASDYRRFSTDLSAFTAEQKEVHAESVAAADARADAGESGEAEEERADASASNRQQVSKLLGKIRARITLKRSDAWIDKAFRDLRAVAELVQRDDERGSGPDKAQRHELVQVLDHLTATVLLSPLATLDVLAQLESVLQCLHGVHKEIDERIQSSSALVASKHAAFALAPATPQPSLVPSASTALASPRSELPLVGSIEEPLVKRQRIDEGPGEAVKVKAERLVDLPAGGQAPGAAFEVYVSDLPWGASAADVESFFGIAGRVEAVRMPTMEDGSTVGVAVVAFADFNGMAQALRMNGYPFNGKTVRVAGSRSG